MYLLRSQLELDATLLHELKLFCDFVSIFSTSCLLHCSLASEAVLNDLQFYQSMTITTSLLTKKLVKLLEMAF